MSAQNLSSQRPVKPYKGLAMEGMIARWYAKSTGRAPEQKATFNKVKGELTPGTHVLEVAPGPGFLAIEFAKTGDYKVTALEISKTFIEIAQENAKQANVIVDFRHGNASDMPFEENTFDFIICVAAFKNFTQPVEAIREMYRVLRPGGKACIMDLRRDVPMEKIDRHIKEDLHMKGFNAWMTKFIFRHTLIKNAYTTAEIQNFASQTKFRQAKIVEDTLGLEIWLEK
ncbi:MAG TPA: class I SAM-dependent methyltransferase [Anaerolineales bacterium]|nr:class I SAM-dependent methyltransferase [Anaerolineales bacterium]